VIRRVAGHVTAEQLDRVIAVERDETRQIIENLETKHISTNDTRAKKKYAMDAV